MDPQVSLRRRFDALLERIAPRNLALALGGLSALTMLVGTCAAYSVSGPLPAPPPPPPSPEKEAVTSYRYKETFYHAQLDEDAQKLKLEPIDPESLKAVNAYRKEFSGSQRLGVGSHLETHSLKIKAIKKRLWIGQQGRGLRAPHLVLAIKNLTDHHLAYRIVTRLSKPCGTKGSIGHNALALKPREQISRVECVLRKTRSLVVKSVEILELTPIGYHYVSRLDPTSIQQDSRTSAGHDYEGLPECRLLPWRVIRDGLASGDLSWRDFIDFYARHDCNEYTFFASYRWSPQPRKRLPARPPQGS